MSRSEHPARAASGPRRVLALVRARRAARIASGTVAACLALYATGLFLQLRAPGQDLPGNEQSLPALDAAFAVVLLLLTLVGVVSETMAPVHVSLWLREAR